MIHQPGYLEPATFSPGQLLSVMGNVGDSQSGKVGESAYTYPVIDAQQLQLWSPANSRSRIGFSFGLGIRL